MTALLVSILIGLSCAATATLPPKPTQPTVVSATGTGKPPPKMRGAQARLMARRAAEVNAVRNLARKLGLKSGEVVKNFRYVKTRELPGGTVEVTVEASSSVSQSRPRIPARVH